MNTPHILQIGDRTVSIESIANQTRIAIDEAPVLVCDPDDAMLLARHIQACCGRRPLNAGKRWTTEEDALLREAWGPGVPLSDLAHRFARTRGSIRARLIHLDLLEDDGGWRRYARPEPGSAP